MNNTSLPSQFNFYPLLEAFGRCKKSAFSFENIVYEPIELRPVINPQDRLESHSPPNRGALKHAIRIEQERMYVHWKGGRSRL